MKIKIINTVLTSLFLVFMIGLPAMAQENSDSAGDHPVDSAYVSEDGIVHDHPVEEAASTAEVDEHKAPPPQSEAPGVSAFLFSGKYLAFLILAAVALTLLLGRWINFWVRIGMLVVAFVLFGLDIQYTYPMHPSPMCATTKLFMFKFTHGQFFPAFIAMFLAIFIPSLIGRKLFSRAAGETAGLIMALYGTLIFFDNNFAAFGMHNIFT